MASAAQSLALLLALAAGLALVAFGAYQVSEAAGLITGGVLLSAGAVGYARGG